MNLRLIYPCIAALAPAALCADPESEVLAAFRAFQDLPNYSWQTTRSAPAARPTAAKTPGNSGAGTTGAPAAPPRVIREGETERNGYTLTKLPSGTITGVAVRTATDAGCAETPDGWLTSRELAQALGAAGNRIVEVQGRKVSLHRYLSTADRALHVERPDEELGLFINAIKTFELVDGLIYGEISTMAAKRIEGSLQSMGPPRSRFRVMIRIEEGMIREYAVQSLSNSRRKSPATESVENWRTRETTTILKPGATVIEVPKAALDKLAP